MSEMFELERIVLVIWWSLGLLGVFMCAINLANGR